MRISLSVTLSCGLSLAAASVATAAGQSAAGAPRPADRTELRHQIYVMEGALSRAVEFGAQKLNKDIRAVMPDVFMLAGDARARGVYLDGYGVFFDVEVPMLRQSMMWSLRMMLGQDDTTTRAAIADLRRLVQQKVSDPTERQALEASLRQLESKAAPGTGMPRPSTVGAQGGADPVVTPGIMLPSPGGAQAAPRPSLADKPWLQDPNRAYTEAVQRALVDAILDYGLPMPLGADEWLTVAARDNEQRDSLAPQDPYEEVVTVLLRIKGSDLQAYRSGQIDKDEARRRVRIGEF